MKPSCWLKNALEKKTNCNYVILNVNLIYYCNFYLSINKIQHFPYVTAAGSFTVCPSVFPVIPRESGIPSSRAGSARPYQVVNRILIYSGGQGLPHQQGWGHCFGLLSTLLSGTTVLTPRTKREEDVGTVPTAGTVSSTPCF